MLSELKLSNFRIFDDEATVRFRPITVLIGRNNSGKSSIIKFLLMLRQSTMSTRSQFPVVNGEGVELGTFVELKNSMTTKAELRFELSFRTPFSDVMQSVSNFLQRFNVSGEDNLSMTARGEIPYSGRASEGTITYSLVQANSSTLYVVHVSTFAEDYNFSVDAITRKLDEIQTVLKQAEDPNDLNPQLRENLKGLLEEYVDRFSLGMVCQSELDSTRHFSPVRAEPERVVVTSHIPVDNLGPEGRYSVARLQLIKTEDEDLYQFLLPHLRNVAGVGSFEFQTDSSELTQAYARNEATGARVLIADFGFGVGQCLPIFVQGAIMPQYSTLMVEQPEAQLHPTAQLEMGSFFAELWSKRHVGSVIETHSGNILLRLRRLIAKGDLSNQDVSIAFFTVDENNRNKPMIKNLDISEDGSIQSGLPMEFFGADIWESLQLGVGA
jgi:predicted ATPase